MQIEREIVFQLQVPASLTARAYGGDSSLHVIVKRREIVGTCYVSRIGSEFVGCGISNERA